MNARNPRVVVTDAGMRTAMYAARALQRAGFEVAGVAPDEIPARFRRYYHSLHRIPGNDANLQAWIDAINRLAEPGDTLIPVSMDTLYRLVRHRSLFSETLRLPAIAGEAFWQVCKKHESIALMQRLGIPVPETRMPRTRDELLRDAGELGYPLVVKVREEKTIDPNRRYVIVAGPDGLEAAYDRIAAVQPEPLVQQYVRGAGVGVSLLADRGRILALFAHERLREQFKRGGPSTDCRAIRDETLETFAYRFAEATQWDGLAMLEFKYDRERNQYYFMEVNPRFWGSLELAIRCGVDFPVLYARWIRGEIAPNAPVVVPVASLRLKYLELDLAAFLADVREERTLRAKIRRWLAYTREFNDPALEIESTMPAGSISGPHVFKRWKIALYLGLRLVRKRFFAGKILSKAGA